MPLISLPDGSQRLYDAPLTVAAIAQDIGASLARVALAAKVDDLLVDLSHTVESDARVCIVTPKDDDGLEIIRHSCAHLMAQAVKQLYPTAQVTIGPVIDSGFYYDFAYERPFTTEDLTEIEARMHALAEQNLPVSRSVWERDQAVAFFQSISENYKADIIAAIPQGDPISLYQQGDFMDLCRGPHVPATGHIKAFKLMKVAGAYWRGDSKNAMLQRIYGTAWADKKQLKAYLTRLEEAEKRDHRKLAKRLDLFHIQEESPGMIFWHANGWAIYHVIEQYMRDRLRTCGYEEIKTPQVADMSLWQDSGHADKFGDNMFSFTADERVYALKPMNCPCHVQVFNHTMRSYRDLPMRLAEFGSCHRNELSGALHGLMRVRGFVQDDGHIFCAEEDIQPEVVSFIDMLHSVYRDFGFSEVQYHVSTRPQERVGSEQDWDRAEQALMDALDSLSLPWQKKPGEGAFYGPKIEFSLADCIGRVWQCGTVQVDFSMPGRLGASYIAQDGQRRTPVMLHRAILGSFERFIGILLEQYEGRLPVWLAPVQAVVLTIADRHQAAASALQKQLSARNFRVSADLRNEKIGLKIREHTLCYVPYLLIIGDREVEQEMVAVRTLAGSDLGSMSMEAISDMLQTEVSCRSCLKED